MLAIKQRKRQLIIEFIIAHIVDKTSPDLKSTNYTMLQNANAFKSARPLQSPFKLK